MRTSALRSARRSARMPTTSASTVSRRSSTRTRCRTRSSRSSSARRQPARREIGAEHDRQRAQERGCHDECRDRSQPAPAVYDADAEDEERDRPYGEHELSDEEHALARSLVRATRAERVASVHGEPQREQEEDGQRKRHECEAEGLTRSAEAPDAAKQADAEEQREPDHEVADEPV